MKKNEFAALGIEDNLAEALHKFGYAEPTPIQKEAIPAVLSGADLIAQAQTGTGKTLAFVLPMLETVRPESPNVQALIVTPTRELAIQITDEVKRWAAFKELSVLSAYGGQDVERQIHKLEGSVHIIIATPGRLLDHIRRGTVKLHKLSMLVLDEADQMLHMGFLSEVEEIISVTPSRRQTLLFSATMPPRIRQLAKEYMRPPVEIEVKAKRVTLDEIEQVVIQTTDRGKFEALCKIIDEENPYLAMVFCRTKLRASKLRTELAERGYSCDELHGDLTQAKREQVMKRFRDAKIQLLVATDVAARGLDVEGITHVINYDIPHDAESYIHRIGRTGRAGQTGKAMTFAAPRDGAYLELIERGIKATLSKRSGRGQQADAGGAAERPGRGGAERQGHGTRGQSRGGGRAGQGRGRGAAQGTQRGASRRGSETVRSGPGWQSEAAGAPERGGRGRADAPGRSARGAQGRRGGASAFGGDAMEREEAQGQRASRQGRGGAADASAGAQRGSGRRNAGEADARAGAQRSGGRRNAGEAGARAGAQRSGGRSGAKPGRRGR